MNIFNELLGGISLKIIYGQSVSHTENWYETKTKLYSTVWCIRRGKVHVSIGPKEYIANEGDVILFSPGDTYSAFGEGECEFVYVTFNLELGHLENAPSGSISGILSGEGVRSASFSFCNEYIKRTNEVNHPGIDAYATFFSFITEMLLKVRDGECIFFREREATVPSSDMKKAIEYMSEHFDDGTSVKDVASRFNISEKYFISRFKSITGIPPKKYLIECRMRRAIELLRDREKTMTEIARALGYSDQYSFSKAFKKHYGEPPSAFR